MQNYYKKSGASSLENEIFDTAGVPVRDFRDINIFRAAPDAILPDKSIEPLNFCSQLAILPSSGSSSMCSFSDEQSSSDHRDTAKTQNTKSNSLSAAMSTTRYFVIKL